MSSIKSMVALNRNLVVVVETQAPQGEPQQQRIYLHRKNRKEDAVQQEGEWETGTKRHMRLDREFNAASELNLNRAMLYDLKEKKEYLVTTLGRLREAICPTISGGYGPLPITGRKANVAGYRPLLAETLVESGYVNGVGEGSTSVWHFEVPEQFKNEDFSWWPEHIFDLFVSEEECTYASCDSGKVSVRRDAHKPGWLGFLGEWGFGISPTAGSKIKKRLGIADRAMPFVAAFKRSTVRIGFIKEPSKSDKERYQLWKIIHDGGIPMLRSFAARVFNAKQQSLDMGPDWQKALDACGGNVPEETQVYHTLQRQRMIEDRIKRALTRTCGNARVLVGGLEEALLKGDYFLNNKLEDDNGHEIDILICRENLKGEITSIATEGDPWVLVGLEPSKVKKGTRTSTQKLINFRALFPDDQVVGWIRQEAMRILEQLTAGRLEEEYRLAAEENDALDEVDEVTRSVSRRHRNAFELAIGAGLGVRSMPTAVYNAFKSLMGRMAFEGKAKMNVPVPHSYSMHLIPETFARQCGWRGTVNPGEIDIDAQRGYAVISDSDWEVAREDWGGSDHDDHYDLILVADSSDGNKRKIVVLRDPNDIGEYAVFTPVGPTLDQYRDKWDDISMKVENEGASFSFTRKPKGLRKVDLSRMPERMSSRLASGKTVITPPKGIDDLKMYEEGYTKEEVLKDLKNAFVKEQPGFAVNARMLVALLNFQLDKIPCRMEKIIDIFMQGGSQAAMKAVNAESEDLVQRSIAYCLDPRHAQRGAPKRIDRLFWQAKGFKVPEAYKQVDQDLYLEDGWLTQLFASYGKVLGEFATLLKDWLVLWQQPIPALTRHLANSPMDEASQRRLTAIWMQGPQSKFRELGKASGDGLPKEKVDALREEYVALVQQYVATYGMYPVLMRACWSKLEGDTAGLYQDDLIWNGQVGELVCEWLQGRLTDKGEKLEREDASLRCQRGPCLIDELTFRLVCHSSHHVAHWILEQDEDQREGLIALLKDTKALVREMRTGSDIPKEHMDWRKSLLRGAKIQEVLALVEVEGSPE